MKKLLFFLLFCLFGSLSSFAQNIPGLDPTFATNGIYVGDTGYYGRIVVQPDKKIVVTGQKIINGSYVSVVQRFHDNGAVDNSFANNGQLRFDGLGFNFVNILPLCLQPDGKILVGGGANGDFILARLKPNDGNFDSSFGINGIVVTGLAGSEAIKDIGMQADGKIVISGNWTGIERNIVVARYHPNGTPDSSFGTNGMIWSDWNTWGIEYPTANDVAVLPDGRIVVGAETKINALGGAIAFTAIRLLTDGTLDTSFNHTGIAYTNNNLLGLPYCKTMRLQPDGKVLLSGYADSITVVRLDTSGNPDNGFGKGGTAKIAPGDGITMEIQPDGKILVAGRANAGAPNTPGVVMYRLLTNGSLDYSFGINGEVYDTTYLHTFNELALQSDNKILVCGNSLYNAHPSYPKTAIARFIPDATSAITDLFLENTITLFPNPATNYINIKVLTSKPPLRIVLYSTEGKLLRSQAPPNTNRLSTEGLADGIYYLHVRLADHTTRTKKITIQKK